jgi:hypothetical protein
MDTDNLIQWTNDLDTVPMNKVQKRWVGYIRDGFIKKHHGEAHVAKYEFKRFQAAPWAGQAIALAVESGRKGDEGTAAEIHCRTAYLVVIGPRGGVQVHDNTIGSKHQITKGRSARWMVAGW